MKTFAKTSEYIDRLRKTCLKPEFEHFPLMLSGTAICIYRINQFNEVEILLQKNLDTKKFELPGGNFELKEYDSKEAAIKRLREKTNILIILRDFLSFFNVYPNIKIEFKNKDTIFNTIIVYTITEELCDPYSFISNDENLHLEWLTSKECTKLKIAKHNIQILDDLFNRLK